jgi:hypothetical protein
MNITINEINGLTARVVAHTKLYGNAILMDHPSTRWIPCLKMERPNTNGRMSERASKDVPLVNTMRVPEKSQRVLIIASSLRYVSKKLIQENVSPLTSNL